MFEKVNPSHPDKVADRIAGAIVDYAYTKQKNPKIAVEVLIGHGDCHIIAESSVDIPYKIADSIVDRIATRPMCTKLMVVPQDAHLAQNQAEKLRCGDNGIFCGMPITDEQSTLSEIASKIYDKYKSDGKYIYNTVDEQHEDERDTLIICQSNTFCDDFDWIKDLNLVNERTNIIVNPLGDWTGGTDVDCGATNRKLGSDMGNAVTGGGLHGKDLSKADVTVNIYAHIKAQKEKKPIRLFCAIGDDTIDGKPYSEIVKIARDYIKSVGGFEKFAEWGLV